MPSRNRKWFLFFFLVAIFSVVAGCDDAYRAAAKGSDDIANGVKDAIPAISDLYTSTPPLITKDEKNAAAGALNKLTDLNTEFRNNVKQIHAKGTATKADYLTAASGFVQSARTLLAAGDLNVKNPDAQKKVDSVLQAIKRSEEHTSELQSRRDLVCRLLL